MQPDYTSWQIDPENSERIPADHWDVYLSDKAAYLADPKAAIDAFNAPKEAPKPAAKPTKTKSTAGE